MEAAQENCPFVWSGIRNVETSGSVAKKLVSITLLLYLLDLSITESVECNYTIVSIECKI